MNLFTSKEIKKVLEDYGLPVYSVLKKKRMAGGSRFNLAERGLARQSHSKGTPYWYFQVDLQSNPGVTDEDYDLAVLVLMDAGYAKATHRPWHGLTMELPHAMQVEHRERLKY